MLRRVSRLALPLGLVAAVLFGAAACTLDTQGAGASTVGSGGGGGSGAFDGGAGAGAAATGGSGATGGGDTGGTGGMAGSPTGGAAGAAGVSGSAGAGATGSEDCLDGIDNDGDTLVDCADVDDCGVGFTCIEAAPAGWEGYFRVRGQAYDPAAAPGPACPDGGDPTRYYDGIAGPADCPACECSAPSCTPQPLLCYRSRSCGGTPEDLSPQVGPACIDGGFSGDLSCRLGQSQLIAGSCGPLVATPQLTNPTPFTGLTDVCGQAISGGGGCASGEVCIPRGAGDYAGYACVRQSGEQTCPVDWGLQIVAHADFTDDRACAACSCDSAGLGCGLGSYRTWDDDNCRTCTLCSSPRDVNSTSCVDLTGLLDGGTWSMRRTAEAAASANCTPLGGQPTGSLQGQGTVTFCCQ